MQVSNGEPVAQRAGEPPLRRAISRNMLLLLVVGDVLGAGIYALVGEVGGRVGGAIWTSFLLALVLAVLTAFAYSELVTKYPRAAGAALYVNKAWRRPFVTFLVAFAVMASGLTSAATLSTAFGGDYLSVFIDLPTVPVALAFIVLIALVNFRGIAESARLNVALTTIELRRRSTPQQRGSSAYRSPRHFALPLAAPSALASRRAKRCASVSHPELSRGAGGRFGSTSRVAATRT